MADINQKTSETEDSFKMDDINPYEASSSSNKTRRGIIYLSTVPTGMNVSRIREAFSEYGEVDRIYLARDSKYCLDYTFGWHGARLKSSQEFCSKGTQSMFLLNRGWERLWMDSSESLYEFPDTIRHIALVRGHPFMTSTNKSGFLPPPPRGRPHTVDLKYTSHSRNG